MPRKPDDEKVVQRSVGLPMWFWERLQKEAKESHRTVSEVIRLLLEKAGVTR